MIAPPDPAGTSLAIGGVVLAAGHSFRMGQSKALLTIEGTPFLARAIETLLAGGCDPVIVVVPPGEEGRRMAELAEERGTTAVENPEAGSEQVDSLRLGLGAIESRGSAGRPGCAAAVILPVDMPLVRPATVLALIAAFRARRAPIVRPVQGGRPGHPVLFARSLWDDLRAPGLAEGARDVLHSRREEIEDIPIHDDGVGVDIDTPQDYARALGEHPSAGSSSGDQA
ncbi:nucleotidyltransferase family protein [soil metagenome]